MEIELLTGFDAGGSAMVLEMTQDIIGHMRIGPLLAFAPLNHFLPLAFYPLPSFPGQKDKWTALRGCFVEFEQELNNPLGQGKRPCLVIFDGKRRHFHRGATVHNVDTATFKIDILAVPQ